MDIRVITLRYDDALGGFPEDALLKAISGRSLLKVSEYYFERSGWPHLAFVLHLEGGGGAGGSKQGMRKSSAPDPMERLPPERRKLYMDLKKWRNTWADRDGVPPFVVMRNAHLADICLAAPKSKSALKEISGIGEKTVASYGDEILNLVPSDLKVISGAEDSDQAT